MAEKRYYWLKLKEDYFNNPKIKKLRKIAGGDTYTIIYLKMQLLSIKNGGIIQYEEIENSFAEELALKLDEDVENVQITLSYLNSQGLIEENDKEFLLVEATQSIGSEGQSAERKRLFDTRRKEQALLCNGCVTEVKRTSISNSISNSIDNKDRVIGEEKEVKHKFGEYNHVLLKDSEINKLGEEYGEVKTQEAIKYLDEYIEMKGYKAKSHYLAIKKWVFEALERNGKSKQKKDDSLVDKLERVFEEYDNGNY